MVDGRLRVAAGKLLDVDLDGVLDAAEKAAAALQARTG
jgi:hypothetical protein